MLWTQATTSSITHYRLVNVCSTMGVMNGRYSDALINKFRGGNYTEKDIDHFAEEYKK